MSNVNASQRLVRFNVLIPQARAPQRADRSAGGLLPTRAFRYCEAVTTASGFGWYIFPPISFTLLWDGQSISWTFDGAEGWHPLGRAQFPEFAAEFDRAAPEHAQTYSPPFLAALPEPGVVQIWSGVIARTLPGWSLLVRPPANIPRAPGYELFEGIVETDTWFGPLFSNIRLSKTDTPIVIDSEMPLFQVQPLSRENYADERLNDFDCIMGVDGLDDDDWERYAATVIKTGKPIERPLGEDAARIRRRRRSQAVDII